MEQTPFKLYREMSCITSYAQYEEAHTETELNGNKLKVGFKFQNRSDRKVSHASEYPLIYEGEDCCRLLRELLKRNK